MRSPSSHERTIKALLQKAGVSVGGKNAWDIQVHNPDFYKRVLIEGSIGMGESYMDGWWDSRSLDQLFFRILKVKLDTQLPFNFKTALLVLRWMFFNIQSRVGSQKVARQHYNLNHDFYMLFLGPYNQYTSLYYKGTSDMIAAEELRLKLICEKLKLKKGETVLDIGCGWGGFAKYAAQKYQVHVTGISISDEQIKYARQYTKGLPVKILKKDYRDLSGKFDKVFSGGMLEHVGYKNYRQYMSIVRSVLDDDGLFVLDCLGQFHEDHGVDAWMDKYIFPNSQIPPAPAVTRAINGYFNIEDWHVFGEDYAKTCIDWFKEFHKNWKKIQAISPQFDKRFYRMWKYYLLTCAGALRVRRMDQWQIVFSKNGVVGGYESVR